MLAPWRTPPITIELPIGVELVGLQIPIDRLAARPRGPSARGGLDDDERRLFLRRHFSRRQPSFLQGRELTEKSFLERPTHARSRGWSIYQTPSMRASRGSPDSCHRV